MHNYSVEVKACALTAAARATVECVERNEMTMSQSTRALEKMVGLIIDFYAMNYRAIYARSAH